MVQSLLGLEMASGVSVSVGIALLALLWNFSSLPEIAWGEITAGVMAFVAGAGLNLFAATDALGAFAQTQWVASIVAILNLIGGILVFLGGLRNGLRHLQEAWS